MYVCHVLAYLFLPPLFVGEIILAGGKIILAGGKIILADGKNFWQRSLFSRTGHHSPYDDPARPCRPKAGYGLVLIMH